MADDSDAIGSVIERATASATTGGNNETGTWSPEHVRQLDELREAVAHLRRSVAAASTRENLSASDALDDAVAEVGKTLRRNVFASVGIAAFLGYVWGRFR